MKQPAPHETQLYHSRLRNLTKAIDLAFSDEDALAAETLDNDFEQIVTTMIEVDEVTSRNCTVYAFHEDFVFHRVLFPEDVHLYLGEGDVFLATLGLVHREWQIIYLSPPYKEYGGADKRH